jgi:hypothetical protein
MDLLALLIQVVAVAVLVHIAHKVVLVVLVL